MDCEKQKSVKEFPIKDLVDLGILQEANRVFFHPLGLALTVVGEKRRVSLHGIAQTSDPEGFEYDEIDQLKASRFQQWEKGQSPQRTAMAQSKRWVSKVQPIKGK